MGEPERDGYESFALVKFNYPRPRVLNPALEEALAVVERLPAAVDHLAADRFSQQGQKGRPLERIAERRLVIEAQVGDVN